MILQLQNSGTFKATSILLAFTIFLNTALPSVSFAQAGPAQNSDNGYSLNTTNGMVNEFTGDFFYNIPLLDVDGFPISIAYNSNVTMFEEASWVGLGWDLNVGSVSRDMRGIPDDFNGSDEVLREIGMKNYTTEGKKDGGSFGIRHTAGFKIGASVVYGTYTNSLRGNGVTWDFGMNSTVNYDWTNFNWGVGFSFDTQNGAGRNNSIGVGGRYKVAKLGLNVSQAFSSRAGLTSTNVSLSGELTKSKEYILPSGEKKTGYSSLSVSSGSSYSLGTQTSVPRFNLPSFGSSTYTTHTITGIVNLQAVRLEAGYIHSDYFLKDILKDNKRVVRSAAYGYYHMGKGQRAPASQRPMMDFNRERESEFSEEMVKLPFSAPTYDLFNVSALGLAGNVRGQRKDIGTLQDPTIEVDNEGKTKDFEYKAGYGVPNAIILGFSYGQGSSVGESQSGNWNTSSSSLLRWNAAEKNGFEEGVFFKSVGEPTPRNMQQWNDFYGKQPVRLNIYANNENIYSSNTIATHNSSQSLPSTSGSAEEGIRASYYQPHTAQQYASLPAKDKIHYQPETTWGTTTQEIARVGGIRKAHHISALEATSAEGINYYFDIPVYNIQQTEVVFTASGLKGSLYTSKGLVSYGSTDNTTANNRGRNGFFEKTTIPAYAGSYLLSLMTSSDYIDRTGDGPTTDDFGNYYKFNYTRIYGDNGTPYKWRFPYEKSTAKLNEGHKSTPFDDMATYEYGEKEIWYVKSVETKNYIVEFHLNAPSTPRKDGYGVLDENGGLNSAAPLRRLEKIVVYNRDERLQKGYNAVPVQTVSFKYDYSLCKGTPSNIETNGGNYAESGKLTLKSIHFSGRLSEQGNQAPYQFSYADNPDFSYININRWGGYKLNNSTYNNIDYPYAEQNSVLADQYARSWKIQTIETPASGTIRVDYEADRYSYTQNRKVMKMIRVKGMASEDELDSSLETGTPVYHSSLRDVSSSNSNKKKQKTPYNVIYFELDAPLTGSPSEQKQKLINQYLKLADNTLLKEILFQVRVKIDNSIAGSYENILGFGELSDRYGVIGTGAQQTGYIVLKKVDVKDRSGSTGYMVNPVQKAAWQYARLNIEEVIYGNCDFNQSSDPSACNYDNDLDAAVVFGANMNKQLNKKSYCLYFDPNHSFVRLHDSRGYQYGGNARVKSITYTDNWDRMSEESLSDYQWEYLYDTPEKNIYNGVAAYEPALGNIVNPFYQWSTYTNDIRQFPDESKMTIEPVGELLFPVPVVGYKEVRVKFRQVANLLQNAVGEKVSTFYTAKDKPTYVDVAPLQKESVKKNRLIPGEEVRITGLSQGYTIATNDFHGKIKSEIIYDAHGTEISRSGYIYSDDNKVNTLNRGGQMQTETIATEYDIYADARFVETKTSFNSIGGGLEIHWYLPWTIVPFPEIQGARGTTRKGFFVHTINKHINQSAVLKRVETTYLGSATSAENIVYDRFSGNVLVSSVNDEFNESLYSVSYPAHWYYPGLQNKYINSGLSLSNVTINNGILSTGGSAAPFVPGDQFSISPAGTLSNKAWVLKNTTGAVLIDDYGLAWNSGSHNYTIKLVESGRKNRIMESMMEVITKQNPINGNTFTFPTEKIVNVAAAEYDHTYSIPCFVQHNEVFSQLKPTPNEFVPGSTEPINPFLKGTMGNLVSKKQYAFKEQRTSGNQGIRKEGFISNYLPFYQLNGTTWQKNNTGNKYRELQYTRHFDELGRAFLAKDPIDIYSTILYGFNPQQRLLPVASATNADRNQIAFDGFEDRNYYPGAAVLTAYSHFDLLEVPQTGVSVTSEERHSGLKSLRLEGGKSTYVKRKVTNVCGQSPDGHTSSNQYKVQPCDCITQFSPYPGKYMVSAWVKVRTAAPDVDYNKVVVKVQNGSSTLSFRPSGPVIDGWQRTEGIFDVQTGSADITVSVVNELTGNSAYIDDIRIHPVNAVMSTIVYNPENLLPIASHDDNNYTTFYNYDENNQLVRVRVETIRGIYTTSESRQGIRKRYTN